MRSGLTLSKNMKGLAPFSDQSEIRKMSIEGRHLVDTQASHHSETRAIHDGKILVTPGNAKVQRDLKIRQSNRLTPLSRSAGLPKIAPQLCGQACGLNHRRPKPRELLFSTKTSNRILERSRRWIVGPEKRPWVIRRQGQTCLESSGSPRAHRRNSCHL
jgi:hypothetical protein